MQNIISVLPGSARSLVLDEVGIQAHVDFDEDTCTVEVYSSESRRLTVVVSQGNQLFYRKTTSYIQQTHVVCCDAEEGFGLDPEQSISVTVQTRPAVGGADYSLYGALTRYRAS